MAHLSATKAECCGCKVCSEVCQKDAISFSTDEEGFWYPKVDETKCVDCGMCEQVCPQLQTAESIVKPLAAYAAKNNDKHIVQESSSGGVFTALAETVIEQGGHVYGVIYDSNIKAKFICATTKSDLQSMRGSKYVQADPEACFSAIMGDLIAGIFVMFVGTPCQVAAIRELTQKHRERVLLVDFICHGVTSPEVFGRYIEFVEKKRGKKITEYHNRSKSHGWKHCEESVFEDGSRDSETLLSQAWRNIYHTLNCLRPSCYECRYNHYEKRKADLTIADYWGIEKHHPDFEYKNGASLIAVYTEQGAQYLEQAKDRIELAASHVEYALERQPHFRGEPAKDRNRIEFWQDYRTHGMSRLVKKYGNCSLKMQIKHLVKRIVKKQV